MLQESILQYFGPAFVFKTFVLSFFERPLKTDFTEVFKFLEHLLYMSLYFVNLIIPVCVFSKKAYVVGCHWKCQ